MCAKKVRVAGERSDDVLARRAAGSVPRTEVADTDQMDDETTLRVMRNRMTWREWVLYDFLRYWYGLGAMTLVAFSTTYIAWQYHVRDPIGLAALGIGAFALVVLEFLLYREIWPQGPFTKGWPAGKRLRMLLRRLRWRL